MDEKLEYNDLNNYVAAKMNGKEDENIQDDDIEKIDRLQLINASARYQLLSANQQLLDFHLSRIIKSKEKKKTQTKKILKE